MKNTIKKLLTAATLLALLTAAGCNEDDPSSTAPVDQLPPLTQTGENTFGCLVNGIPVIPGNTFQITAIYQGGLLQMGAGEENETEEIDVTMVLEDPLSEDITYNLTNFPVHRARIKRITSSSKTPLRAQSYSQKSTARISLFPAHLNLLPSRQIVILYV